MKQKQQKEHKQPWHRKPSFGSLYTMNGSKYIYISMNYYKQRLRFPTDREDNPKNWDELCDFMEKVGQKIKNRTFVFAKTFYWLDKATKEHFTQLEGGDFKPEPEHVLFGDYAGEWMEKNIPSYFSPTKRRDYLQVLNSRILPYFKKTAFSQITATEVQTFVDNIDRCDRTQAKKRKGKPGKPLSVKRLKNIIGPMKKIWIAACNDYNWNLRDPFTGISAAYEQHAEKTLQMKAEEAVIRVLNNEKDTEVMTREVFLFSEWQKLLNHIDPHYHVVVDLLLMGVIGSELEALLKQHVDGGDIQICCSVVHDEEGRPILKFKPKNWYRMRDIPKTRRLRELLDKACAASSSPAAITFANGITIPANKFVLTMLDGSPFIYRKFVRTVWNKAIKEAELKEKVPYACRHTFVAWSSLIGVVKERLVDLMGHSTKKMIDEKYGKYRKGLVDEKEMILEYVGDDFLSLEELRTAFPERYRERMAVPVIPPQKAQAPALTFAFCQSFSQSQGLYADNYAT